MALSTSELARYARHLSLAEVGAAGQEKLRAARVLVIGAGGLGSPAALYLAACGVGTLGLVDCDRIDISNLQRQVLFDTGSVGRLKTEAAEERLRLGHVRQEGQSREPHEERVRLPPGGQAECRLERHALGRRQPMPPSKGAASECLDHG